MGFGRQLWIENVPQRIAHVGKWLERIEQKKWLNLVNTAEIFTFVEMTCSLLIMHVTRQQDSLWNWMTDNSLLLQWAFTIKDHLTLNMKYEMYNFVLAHIFVILVIRNLLSQGIFLGIVVRKKPISSFKFYLHIAREINFYFFFLNNGWKLLCGILSRHVSP